MAVESRFVVIRHGVEAKTFMDKKSADEYDKMLDMADNLAEIFAQSPIELTEYMTEELRVYLALQRDEVLIALLAKKAAVKKVPKLLENNDIVAEEIIEEKDEKVKKISKTTKAKKSKAKTDEEISEAS